VSSRLAWRHEAERLDGRPAARFAASTVFTMDLRPDGHASRLTLRSQQEPASALKGVVIRRFGRGRSPRSSTSRSTGSPRASRGPGAARRSGAHRAGFAARGRSGEDGLAALGDDAGEAVEPHHLDHAPHLGLRVAHVQAAVGDAQAPGEDRQVEHQRAVGERQLLEVDGDVAAGADRAGQGGASAPLRGDVLVATAAEQSLLFDERNDPGKLHKRRRYTQGPWSPSKKLKTP
jgi:hypothetical protein